MKGGFWSLDCVISSLLFLFFMAWYSTLLYILSMASHSFALEIVGLSEED